MIQICLNRVRATWSFVTPTLTLVEWTKWGETAWPRRATLSCAKTRRSKHEQDMRRRPLSVPQPRLRPTNKRATLIQR
jgi:hypothetical protein